jgi:hypothetical protein
MEIKPQGTVHFRYHKFELLNKVDNPNDEMMPSDEELQSLDDCKE